jgi:Nucleoside 2-deoxyribosyltransferase
MCKQKILIVGNIQVDIHHEALNHNLAPTLRLGGIMHLARLFSALKIDFIVGYYAPDTLDKNIYSYCLELQALGCYKLGTIESSSNIELPENFINSNKSKNNKQVVFSDLKDLINKIKPTDLILNLQEFDYKNISLDINRYQGRIHINYLNYKSYNLDSIEKKIDTLIITDYSIKDNEKLKTEYFNQFKNKSINHFLIENNQKGIICFDNVKHKLYKSPNYNLKNINKTGVSEVFLATFIIPKFEDNFYKKLNFSTLITKIYIKNIDFKKFKKTINELLKNNIINQKSLSTLSWDEKKEHHIYLAAPDFPHVDTTKLEELNEYLLFHNFRPRLPIRENGLVSKNMTYEDELKLYNGDIALLDKSSLLIAILLYNDPGTLVELGMIKQAGKPTIIYDPYNICENLFVRHTADYLCKTVKEVLEATYKCLESN